jgi:hypothetical protein
MILTLKYTKSKALTLEGLKKLKDIKAIILKIHGPEVIIAE